MVRLYSSLNKIKKLGLSLDSSKLSFLDVERLWVIDSAVEKTSMARQKAKGKKHG